MTRRNEEIDEEKIRRLISYIAMRISGHIGFLAKRAAWIIDYGKEGRTAQVLKELIDVLEVSRHFIDDLWKWKEALEEVTDSCQER